MPSYLVTMTLLRGQKSQMEGHLLVRANQDLSRVSTSFDETNLVPNAGLLPAAVLAQRIDLGGLIDSRLHLATHGANSGARALSVLGSMLVGGDSIDDVAVLRAGAAGSLFDATRPDGRVVAAGAQVVQRPAARRDQPGAAGPAVGGRCRTD